MQWCESTGVCFVHFQFTSQLGHLSSTNIINKWTSPNQLLKQLDLLIAKFPLFCNLQGQSKTISCISKNAIINANKNGGQPSVSQLSNSAPVGLPGRRSCVKVRLRVRISIRVSVCVKVLINTDLHFTQSTSAATHPHYNHGHRSK